MLGDRGFPSCFFSRRAGIFISVRDFYFWFGLEQVSEPVKRGGDPASPVHTGLKLFHVNKTYQRTPEVCDIAPRVVADDPDKGKKYGNAGDVFYFYRT